MSIFHRGERIQPEVKSGSMDKFRRSRNLMLFVAAAELLGIVGGAKGAVSEERKLSGDARMPGATVDLVNAAGQEIKTMNINPDPFGIEREIRGGLANQKPDGDDRLLRIFKQFEEDRRKIGMPDPVPGHILQPGDWERPIGEK